MNCEEITRYLDDHVDGELPDHVSAEVVRHLDDCEACRGRVAEIGSLLVAARSLPREVAPQRDLWPEIEARLGRRVVHGPWKQWGRVAMAVAAALIAAVLVLIVRQQAPAPLESPEASLPSLDRGTVRPASSYVETSERVRAENGLMQVRKDLLRSIAERRDDLDPRTVELIDSNLELIDRAIDDIYRALEENPGNRGLEALLAATYQREVDLLRQINLL